MDAKKMMYMIDNMVRDLSTMSDNDAVAVLVAVSELSLTQEGRQSLVSIINLENMLADYDSGKYKP